MNKENKNSSLPMVIIGLVLIAAVAGGWWFYQNSKPATTAKTPASSNRPARNNVDFLKAYQSAPAGAQPANMLGSPSAAVTVEEFADFQCPTCAVVHGKMKEITSIYGNRIKFIYRSFPLTQIHKNAYDAAVAAESAGMQGKYWDMQNQLFTNQQTWANSAEARKLFGEYAQKIGLDVNKFETDMLGLAVKSRVDLDIARGRSLGITGTPSIYINGRPIPFEQFDVAALRQIIDAELQRVQTSGAAQTGNPNQTTATSVASTTTNSNVAVVVPSNANISNISK